MFYVYTEVMVQGNTGTFELNNSLFQLYLCLRQTSPKVPPLQ